MSQQNIYEIQGSTDSITFYSSTQYGPPVGVDLATGQQQIGNQVASSNIQGPLDIIGHIEQFSANTVDRIFDYIDQWSAQAGQAYQSFRERQDAETAKQLDILGKNVQTAKEIGQEVAKVGSNVVSVGKEFAKELSNPGSTLKQSQENYKQIGNYGPTLLKGQYIGQSGSLPNAPFSSGGKDRYTGQNKQGYYDQTANKFINQDPRYFEGATNKLFQGFQNNLQTQSNRTGLYLPSAPTTSGTLFTR